MITFRDCPLWYICLWWTDSLCVSTWHWLT